MKRTFLKGLWISIVVLSGFSVGIADELLIYGAPDGAEPANDFTLEVNGKKVFVYNTRLAAFAYFSFEGKVDIKVITGRPIYNYDVRPHNEKIQATTYRDQIHFSLNSPANLSVEINKNIKRPLFIFANPVETLIPDPKNKDVIYNK